MRRDITLGVLALVAVVAIGGSWKPSLAVDQPAPQNAALEQAEAAMELLRNDDVAGMLKLLKDQLVRSLPDFEATQGMCETHRRLHSQRHGKSLGEVELIRKEVVGDSFIRFSYLERWERHALVWRLGYYRTAEGWKLNEFEWDDKPAALYRATR